MKRNARNPYFSIDVMKQAAASYQQQAGVSPVNTGHPGQNMGLTLQQVKDIIANSEKVQGKAFVSANGEVTPEINFPATAKYLMGFTFSKIANVADTFDLTINNEAAIKTGSAYAYSQKDGNSEEAYFPFARVIGGSTSVELKYNSSVGGENIVFTAHYV